MKYAREEDICPFCKGEGGYATIESTKYGYPARDVRMCSECGGSGVKNPKIEEDILHLHSGRP